MKKKHIIGGIIAAVIIIPIIIIACVVANFFIKLDNLSKYFEKYDVENPGNWIRLQKYYATEEAKDERLGIWPGTSINVVHTLKGIPRDDILYIIDNRMIYTHTEYLIINAGKKEPILNESFSIKEISIELDGETITVTDSTIIDKLVDLRRNGDATRLVYKSGLNGELYGYIHPETNESFSSYTNAVFKFDAECDLYWECRIDVKYDDKIYFVYTEEKTCNDDSIKNIFAIEVTEILKDVLNQQYLGLDQSGDGSVIDKKIEN